MYGNSLELMEAIEYLQGKENNELNNVITKIIEEFLGINEEEAKRKYMK